MRPIRGGSLTGAVVAGALVAALTGCRQHQTESHTVAASAERARLDFALKDPAGATVLLSSFKGHPLIINFWATYCGPCKAEIPVLNDLVAEHRAEHLAVIGISYDDAPSDIVAFTRTTPMHYPVLVGLGHDDFMEAYEAQIALPTTWVIRGDGTVVAKHVGPETREWFEAQVKAAF